MSSSSVLGMRVALLAAEVADAERYRRGRYYVRQGAVVALEVTLGVLFGSVQGSRPSPYTVEVHLQPGRGRMRGPVPGKHDIAARCSCPDDSPCCKHAVAVLVAFAEMVDDEPEYLTDWTGAVDNDADDAADLSYDRYDGDQQDDDEAGRELARFFGVVEQSRLPRRPLGSTLQPLEAPTPKPPASGELESLLDEALGDATRALHALFG